jgi:hypothetical protein
LHYLLNIVFIEQNPPCSFENACKQSHCFTDVRTLEFHGYYNRHFDMECMLNLQIRSTIDLTSVQHLNLSYTSISKNDLFTLLVNIPRATHLTISHIRELINLVTNGHPFNQIKTLTILSQNNNVLHMCGFAYMRQRQWIVEHSHTTLSQFSTCIEHLYMPIDELDQLIHVINELPHLKSATFICQFRGSKYSCS